MEQQHRFFLSYVPAGIYGTLFVSNLRKSRGGYNLRLYQNTQTKWPLAAVDSTNERLLQR